MDFIQYLWRPSSKPLLSKLAFEIKGKYTIYTLKISKNMSLTPIALNFFVVFSLIDMNIYIFGFTIKLLFW